MDCAILVVEERQRETVDRLITLLGKQLDERGCLKTGLQEEVLGIGAGL